MTILKFSALSTMLMLSAESSALNLINTGQPLEHGLYDSRSCNDLYMQATALEQQSYLYKTKLSNNTRAASYALTVFSPAIYYFGFTAYKNHMEEAKKNQAINDIEQVRLRMAEKRCFERN